MQSHPDSMISTCRSVSAPSSETPKYGRSREVGYSVAGFDAVERVTEVHEVARHET